MTTTTETQTILRIGPLADRYGVSAESIRIWERQGRIPRAIRTPGGHRRYGPEHVLALDALLGVRAGPANTVTRCNPQEHS